MIKYRFNPLGIDFENAGGGEGGTSTDSNNFTCLFHFNDSNQPDYIDGCTFTPTNNMVAATVFVDNGRFTKAIETTKYSEPGHGVNFQLDLNKQIKKVTVDFWAYTFDSGYTYAFNVEFKQKNTTSKGLFSAQCYYSNNPTQQQTSIYLDNATTPVITAENFGIVGTTWTHFLITYDLENKIARWFIDGIKKFEQPITANLEYIDQIVFENYNSFTEGYTDELRIIGNITNTSDFSPPTKEYLYNHTNDLINNF